MIKNVSIKVLGRVQGVFFRGSTQKKALELSITGFVRNEPDGSVYIEAEGSEDDLRQFIDWCHVGPSRAKVESCEITNGTVKGYRDFLIQR